MVLGSWLVPGSLIGESFDCALVSRLLLPTIRSHFLLPSEFSVCSRFVLETSDPTHCSNRGASLKETQWALRQASALRAHKIAALFFHVLETFPRCRTAAAQMSLSLSDLVLPSSNFHSRCPTYRIGTHSFLLYAVSHLVFG